MRNKITSSRQTTGNVVEEEEKYVSNFIEKLNEVRGRYLSVIKVWRRKKQDYLPNILSVQ